MFLLCFWSNKCVQKLLTDHKSLNIGVHQKMFAFHVLWHFQAISLVYNQFSYGVEKSETIKLNYNNKCIFGNIKWGLGSLIPQTEHD